MTRRKRQYGSGCLLRRKGGWALRWRETEISPDGTRRRVLRYESLGEMSRKQASDILAQRVVAASTKTITAPSTLTFRELAGPVADDGAADVQALDAEEPRSHPGQAPDASIRRSDADETGAPGRAGIRGAPHVTRLRAQDGRSHPRCLERDPEDCGEVGSPGGQPGPRRRSATAQAVLGVSKTPSYTAWRMVKRDRPSSMSRHRSPNSSPRRNPVTIASPTSPSPPPPWNSSRTGGRSPHEQSPRIWSSARVRASPFRRTT